MNDKISQDTINKALWAACDTFRGTISADTYRRLPCAVSVLNAIYGYPFSASGCKDDHSTSAKFCNE
ncbi:TPA: hypothetical protein KFR63_004178 [Escherichia coli]|nr:hypothetical protein [Escherichia coli]